MAFPTIPTVAAGRVLSNTQANTSGTRTFPSLSGLTKNSGDMLIAICVAYQSSAAAGAVFSAWGAGFTEFLDVGGTTGNMSIGAAYKVSNGSETGTFTVTQAATVTGHAAMFLLSIPGASVGTAPVGGAIANGTTSSANPAALNPATWDVNDTLWIAVAGNGEVTATGSFTGMAGGLPVNYSNSVITGISADTPGGVDAAIAFRQLAAASEDVGTFGVDLSNARNSAVVLAVRPAATTVTIAVAQTTDTAETVSGTIAPSVFDLTLVTETDTVGEIVPLQPLPALETATAPQISTQSARNITTATTTASAQALDVDKSVTITLASETDSVPSTSKTLTFVAETDSAQVLTILHASYTVTPATETDLVGDIVEFQPLPALTTDSPQALTITQSELFITTATETAQAQVLSVSLSGGGHLLGGPATETDLANTIVSLQPLPAIETTSVQALEVIYGGKNIAPAQESDSARSIGPSAGINLPIWEATLPFPYNVVAVPGDTSTAVALVITSGVGTNKTITLVATTDTAQALTVHKRATLTLVAVTGTAQALDVDKSRGFTTATSTALAVGLTFTQLTGTTYTIQPAGDTNTATAIVIFKQIFITLGIVTTTNIARITRAANRPSGGLALIDHEPDSGLVLTDHTETEDLAFIDI